MRPGKEPGVNIRLLKKRRHAYFFELRFQVADEGHLICFIFIDAMAFLQTWAQSHFRFFVDSLDSLKKGVYLAW
ncbi:unnamed protein product [Cylicocyclus nassatus]|uniref:Uncharacterized protein n=1 Tax=Cylicocyclus nassatus TaxID=53992 RepID=A0AA36HAG7_CYLNA|nr:unnamed protein product [Cylicocyclus nassatus]